MLSNKKIPNMKTLKGPSTTEKGFLMNKNHLKNT